MVFGPKKQSFNKIISGKPADVNEYGLPPSVGSKKSGGFANRLLSVAQPRRKTKTPSQRSCEYFFIQTVVTTNNTQSEIFLNTTEITNPQTGNSVFDSATGPSNYDIYKVRLLPVPDDNELVYIQGKNGNYMTVVVASKQEFQNKIIFQRGKELGDDAFEQRFRVTELENNEVTIQTGGDRSAVNEDYYLFLANGDRAKTQEDSNRISLIPARETGNGSC